MKVKVLKVEQAEGRSERATVELRNGVVLQVRSSECADLGTPQAEAALAEDSGKPSTREGDEKVKVRLLTDLKERLRIVLVNQLIPTPTVDHCSATKESRLRRRSRRRLG
jgi:hypothetical protein